MEQRKRTDDTEHRSETRKGTMSLRGQRGNRRPDGGKLSGLLWQLGSLREWYVKPLEGYIWRRELYTGLWSVFAFKGFLWLYVKNRLKGAGEETGGPIIRPLKLCMQEKIRWWGGFGKSVGKCQILNMFWRQGQLDFLTDLIWHVGEKLEEVVINWDGRDPGRQVWRRRSRVPFCMC